MLAARRGLPAAFLNIPERSDAQRFAVYGDALELSNFGINLLASELSWRNFLAKEYIAKNIPDISSEKIGLAMLESIIEVSELEDRASSH